jgi:hypothetical protein
MLLRASRLQSARRLRENDPTQLSSTLEHAPQRRLTPRSRRRRALCNRDASSSTQSISGEAAMLLRLLRNEYNMSAPQRRLTPRLSDPLRLFYTSALLEPSLADKVAE